MRILFLNQAPEPPGGDDRADDIQALLDGYASAGTRIDLGYPDDYSGARVKAELSAQGKFNGLHHAMETTPLIRRAARAEAEGYDAVIQSCTFDPGVEGSRLAVDIPVVGLFRTSLHVAKSLGNKLGVIVPLESHVAYTWRIVEGYGMTDDVVGIRAHDAYSEDMAERHDEIMAETVDAIEALLAEDEAEYIVPLGGALIPYIVTPAELEEATDAPVLNTKAVAVRFTEMCVDLGMTQSPITYPKGDLSPEVFESKEYA